MRDRRMKEGHLGTQEQINAYLKTDHQEIKGWFYPLDMVLFCFADQLQKQAGIRGDIFELGVHHGKSLVLLSLLSRRDEMLYAMDLYREDFLQQTQNNMERFGQHQDAGTVEYIVGDSSAMTIDELMQRIQRPLRLLHIDAGHEYHEVLQSLYLLAPFVSSQGIIIMDDYHDREFPGIDAAIYDFARMREPRRFVPFLCGGNKLYLCAPALARQYQHAVLVQPNMQDKCRISRVDDYFVLISHSKLPMNNEHIERILDAQLVPYEYDFNNRVLQREAELYGQRKMALKGL
jgi:cephalosporin hydroxylase